ncbi:MAG TPA: hypothetical protein V6D02_09510 [Candidatus Obscuribacterales bacterium]
MDFSFATTLWILTLAVGYLLIVYVALWWAQRTGKASKRLF